MKSVNRTAVIVAALLLNITLGNAEDALHITFDTSAQDISCQQTWGDKPDKEPELSCEQAGEAGNAFKMSLNFGAREKKLAYWTFKFPEPIPIVSGIETLSFRVKANVPVGIKVPISPFGFIYHGPQSKPGEWQTVEIKDAYDELTKWCRRGKKDSADGYIPGIIVAVGGTEPGHIDLLLDDIRVSGGEGISEAIRKEGQRRQFRRVRLSTITLPWSDEGRTLETVLDRLDEAALGAASDVVCLPMECVKNAGEPIPGPISRAIAAKAAEHRMYIIGNIQEVDDEKTYITSFLCDRDGNLVGTYRKSHKLPDETMDLGDDLPVFATDFGLIAMRIGSDRYFADIDHVYTAKGARVIFWSQEPEPVEDEYLQDMVSAGRASDYRVFIACSRYSRAESGWITNKFPPYTGSPVGRSYIFNREGQRIACTSRKGTVATAVIPFTDFSGPGRQPNRNPAFAAITQPVVLPPEKEWTKRKIRATVIQNHVGFDDLLEKLDEAGSLKSDVVCTYEFVWVPVHGKAPAPEQIERLERIGSERCAQVAAKARQWNMYVILCGVLRKREINEGIIFDRTGRELGRYVKMATTYPEQIPGKETPVFETDFGRIAIRICADNYMVEQDRCYGIKGADIVFFATQDWGPDAIYRNLRAKSRCMDAQMFHVQATHSCTEAMHRSIVIDPCGVPVTRSAYRRPGIMSAVIDLDNDRPRRYTRNYTPHTPKGYLPQYQSTTLPEEKNDLKITLLKQRRPKLYQILAPKEATE